MSVATANVRPGKTGTKDWPLSWNKVAPAVSAGRGRGLFAVQPIAAGEIIDCACSVPLTSPQCDQLETILPLGDFYFRHPEDPDQGLLLLGQISLVNHSAEPNAEVRFAFSEALGWLAELVGRCPIEAGEEITCRYRCEPWFTVG